MSLPLQVIVADPELGRAAGALGDGAAVFAWDDQPDVAARAARHARELLEATGARGEGGFARLVLGGGAVIDGGPAPIVDLRVDLGEGPEAEGLVVPSEIGPRVLGRGDRLVIAGHLAGWIADVAAGPSAREGLGVIREATGARASALAAVARFPVARLERRLVRRALGAVAARLQESVQAGIDGAATPPTLDGLAIDPTLAEPLGARVADEGPALARHLAGQALAAADTIAGALAAEVDRVLAQQGLAGLEPLRAMVAELARRVADGLPTGATITRGPIAGEPGAPSRAALDEAERAMARVAAPSHGLWPLELTGALGGATVGALAVGPLLPALDRVPGGGAGLAAGVALGLGGLAAVATRGAQRLVRRATTRALDDAREGYAAAWRDAARAWMRPIGALAERRARLRLLRALDAERQALDAVAADLEALRRAGARPVASEAEPERALATTIEVEAAMPVLALPIEPLVARADAEVRRATWREERPLLRPEGVEAAARASHLAAGWSATTGLPLAARADLTAALGDAVTSGLAALRDLLVRWVPEGLPARRFVATPQPLAGAVPEAARLDERLACRRDLWMVTLWRPA
ncbi:MAG: hypothetical protein IT385_12195 [Deltaproteobacteria bacterium]|nr:hypothetical protein [Deltaproteobacteria bacterium]